MQAKLLLIAAAVLFGSGCTSVNRYLLDRGRDVADVFTLTVGTGLGATARIGPLHGGLCLIRDRAGLTGGLVSGDIENECRLTLDPFLGMPALEWSDDFWFYADGFGGWDTESIAAQRKKNFKLAGPCPFIAIPEGDSSAPAFIAMTQVDIAAALGISVRVGVNAGEILDLILGIFTIDIAGDDIGPVSYTNSDEKMKLDAEKRLNENPNDINSAHWMGVYHQRHGNPAKARKYFERCLEIKAVSNNDAMCRQRALIYLALICVKKGEKQLAEQHYQEFLKTKPDLKNDLVLLNCNSEYLQWSRK